MDDYLNRAVSEFLTIDMPKNVIFKTVDIDEQGRFWLSNTGILLSVCRKKPFYKSFTNNGKGYYQTEINGNKYYLHRLLAFTFTPDKVKKQFKDYLEIHHIDRNRKNNSLDNLAIVSKKKHLAIHNIWDKLDSWEVIPWEKSRPSQISE